MKLNNTKKRKKQFDPIHHWYMLLLVIFSLTIVIITYSVYSFLYLKNEIAVIGMEIQNNLLNSTSTEFIEKSRNNTKSLEDINNLNKTLEEFNKKELEYNKLIKAPMMTLVTATSTASAMVATSTN